MGKKKAKLAKAEQELKKLSDNKILVRVYKNFGSNTSFLKAEYKAEEKRDQYNNLVSVNESYRHSEDTDFLIDDVYREMAIILEFGKKTKEQRVKLLNDRIEEQDKLLKYLKKHIPLNAIYNYADENLKSRDYKLLKNYISQHDESGAYFTIEKGMRVYSYESVDGFLVPIWHGIDTYSKYPDHTRKMRINIQEEQKMKEEMKEYNREKLVTKALTFAMILTGIIFAATLLAGFKVWEEHNNIEDKINSAAYSCADLTSRMNMEFIKLMDQTLVIQTQREIERSTIKKEDTDLAPEGILTVIK